MFDKINSFFSIEDKNYKKYRKDRFNQKIRIEEYRNEII